MWFWLSASTLAPTLTTMSPVLQLGDEIAGLVTMLGKLSGDTGEGVFQRLIILCCFAHCLKVGTVAAVHLWHNDDGGIEGCSGFHHLLTIHPCGRNSDAVVLEVSNQRLRIDGHRYNHFLFLRHLHIINLLGFVGEIVDVS